MPFGATSNTDPQSLSRAFVQMYLLQKKKMNLLNNSLLHRLSQIGGAKKYLSSQTSIIRGMHCLELNKFLAFCLIVFKRPKV